MRIFSPELPEIDHSVNRYDNFWEKLEGLVEDIKAWDKQDAEELCDLLNDFEVTCNDFNKEYVGDRNMSTFGLDICQLPTCKIPDGVEAYPIWAMDTENKCVVGGSIMFNDKLFYIESLKDIEESYTEED